MIYFETTTLYLKMGELYGWYSDDSVISLLKNIYVISNNRFDYNSIAKTYKHYEKYGSTSPTEEYGVSFNGKNRLFTAEADKKNSMILLMREFTNKEELN